MSKTSIAAIVLGASAMVAAPVAGGSCGSTGDTGTIAQWESLGPAGCSAGGFQFTNWSLAGTGIAPTTVVMLSVNEAERYITWTFPIPLAPITEFDEDGDAIYPGQVTFSTDYSTDNDVDFGLGFDPNYPEYRLGGGGDALFGSPQPPTGTGSFSIELASPDFTSTNMVIILSRQEDGPPGIPEPSTYMLMAGGLAALTVRRYFTR